jgi:hypothetical protein
MQAASDEHLEALIERSTLGGPGARTVRARTTQAEADRVRELAGRSARSVNA